MKEFIVKVLTGDRLLTLTVTAFKIRVDANNNLIFENEYGHVQNMIAAGFWVSWGMKKDD